MGEHRTCILRHMWEGHSKHCQLHHDGAWPCDAEHERVKEEPEEDPALETGENGRIWTDQL